MDVAAVANRIVCLIGNLKSRRVAHFVGSTEAPENDCCGSMRFCTHVALDPWTVTSGPIPFRMADI
jgi:hypothetical protein